MTAVTAGGAALVGDLTTVSTSRRIKNHVMTALMALSLVIVAGLLLLVLVTVVQKGWAGVSRNFPAWFTEDISASKIRAGGGMRSAIVGTIAITFGATALAVPLGIPNRQDQGTQE